MIQILVLEHLVQVLNLIGLLVVVEVVFMIHHLFNILVELAADLVDLMLVVEMVELLVLPKEVQVQLKVEKTLVAVEEETHG